MSKLFSPFQLKDVKLKNRIAVPPMCQYSAKGGYFNDWHHAHYAELARGGAGLVVVEATGVSPEGRITPACTGIWDDAHVEGMTRIVNSIRASGSIPGIQIAHAGRKASANVPWEGDDHMVEDSPNAWCPIAPSAIPFGANLPRTPKEMSLADIQRVQANFVSAAQRARHSGFQWLELHFAHGYLAQSFFSVHSNQRTDGYGGTLEGRCRFLLETLSAVRTVWPENLPLTARFGVIEFDGRDEETLQESIYLAKEMRERGLDMMSVSIGFSTPTADIPWGPGFLAPIAGRVKQETGLPVSTAWGIDDPHVAEKALQDEQIDLVMIGKSHLANPHYPYQLALALGEERPSWVLPAPYAHWLERYAGPWKQK